MCLWLREVVSLNWICFVSRISFLNSLSMASLILSRAISNSVTLDFVVSSAHEVIKQLHELT
jgi:hypothetical protein